MTFGEELKRWREEAGVSQASLEDAIGKSRGYIARLESGTMRPTKPVTDAIAQALRGHGVDVTDAAIWESAAGRAAKDDVRNHYEGLLERQRQEFEERLAAGENLSSSELRLVKAVRGLQATIDSYRDAMAERHPDTPRERLDQLVWHDLAESLTRFLDAALEIGVLSAHRDASEVDEDEMTAMFLGSLFQPFAVLSGDLRPTLIDLWVRTGAGLVHAQRTNPPPDPVRRYPREEPTRRFPVPKSKRRSAKPKGDSDV